MHTRHTPHTHTLHTPTHVHTNTFTQIKKWYFLRLAVKMMKMDNRKVLGLFLFVALCGSLLLGDWQSIGRDTTCSITNTTTGALLEDFNDFSTNGEGSGSQVAQLGLIQATLYANESCEGNSPQDCFWNPVSRITGEECNTCLPACLSRSKSLCFYQFSVGVLMLAIATPLIFVFVSIIASDIMPVGSQVKCFYL